MSFDLTQASSNEYNKLFSQQMTPEMAASYLREGRISLRSFGEVLRKFYPAGDILPRLIAAFQQESPELSTDAVSKKLRNWLSGRNMPTSREDVFQIAFALELTETLRSKEKKGSLLWVLDSTKTSMGRRMLKNWIEQPLKSPTRIIERLEAVDVLYRKSVVLSDLTDLLDRVYDLERLMTKVMYKTANPRDLKALSATAMQIPLIKKELEKLGDSKLISQLNSNISQLEDIVGLVENAIMEEPPVSVKDGGVIRDGFNEELDSL